MELIKTHLLDSEATFIQKLLDHTRSQSEPVEQLKTLVENSEKIALSFQKIGDAAFEDLEKEESLEAYIMTFSWSEMAKSFLLLWRNTIFQQVKAHLFYSNGKIQAHQLEVLKSKSQLIVQNALTELMGFPAIEKKRIQNSAKQEQKQLDRWRLQQNPYPIYRKQFDEIPLQCKELLDQYNLLQASHQHFENYSALIRTTIQNCKNEIQEIQTRSEKINGFIEKNIESSIDSIPKYMNEKIEETFLVNHINAFTIQSDRITDLLETKVIVPVHTDGGSMTIKTLNFQRKVTVWLDSEVLPILYKIWEIAENTSNGMKMSLLNIRNRALLYNENKKGTIPEEEIRQPLNQFLKRTETYQKNLALLANELESQLVSNLQISEVFDLEKEFLPVQSQTTVNQVNLNQKQWLVKLNSYSKNTRRLFQRFKASVAEHGALTVSEKIVRYVQSRSPEEVNHQYSNIFLTKGYIGESFWTGREKEIKRVESLVLQWRSNFRGAVILSGQRFSGKTLFGELAAKKFFLTKHVIRLRPNTTLNIESRKFETTYDLGAALDFIRKYTINNRHLVWIDDLELWIDAEISLSQNFRALRKHIDSYSRQTFFMVSMSNWLKAHLQKVFAIDKVFQAEINLDQMEIESMRKAILVRHGATQKTLCNKNGEPFNSFEFQRLCKKIHRASEGNIGEALRHWAFVIKKSEEEEKVVFNAIPPYSLPNFINPDTAILLTTIMLEKRTNDYRLRREFGQVYKEKFGGVLQRLISTGVTNRTPEGLIEVNEAIVNPLGKLLESKEYLTFYYK